jgi:hypothetical protein
MSHSRRLVVVMATLAALVAVPTTASAKSSTASVQIHVVKAKKAVKLMNRAAKAGDGASVVRQLRVARSQNAAASRKARAMAAGSDSVAAAQALALAGMSYEQLIASITRLVDEVKGQAQKLLAQAMKPSLVGQAHVIRILASLLDDVPASVRPILAAIVTALAVGDADEVTNMDAAIRSGKLPVNVSAIVKQALDMATQYIKMAFSAIKAIVPTLPAPVQGSMLQILNLVTSTVGTIVPSVLRTVTGLIDTILGSLPFVGTAAGAGGLTGTFGGLLGAVTGGGQNALPGDAGNILGNLLSGLFGGGSTAGGSAASSAASWGLSTACWPASSVARSHRLPPRKRHFVEYLVRRGAANGCAPLRSRHAAPGDWDDEPSLRASAPGCHSYPDAYGRSTRPSCLRVASTRRTRPCRAHARRRAVIREAPSRGSARRSPGRRSLSRTPRGLDRPSARRAHLDLDDDRSGLVRSECS